MKIIYIILAVIVLVGIGWFVFSGSETPNTSPTETTEEVTDTQQEQSMSLSEAQEAVGMECAGSDVSMKCTWNGAEYDFLMPADWENDRTKRVQACEQGYINERYNMVTDGETWYATANFEEENTLLVNAFNEIGFESTVASYCR